MNSPPSVASTEVGPLATLSTPPTTLDLSVTRTWGNRTLPVKSAEWRKLRAEILIRDNRTCASCGHTSPHPNGRGLKIDHRNGDASNNDRSNLMIHCPPCEAIRHCGFSGMNGWVQLAKSDMDQVEIVRKTREIFGEIGTIPRIREVDPLATRTEIGTVDLANKLMETDRENLTDEEKCLRGFFTRRAADMFAITMAIEPQSGQQPQNASDARALEILDIEQTLPWICFSPSLHSTLHEFFKKWPPSSISQSQVAWIYVDSRHAGPADDDEGSTDMSSLDKAWDDICTERKPAIADLDGLAQRFNMLTGKWLVFARVAEVDSLWRRIASATHAGTLGTAAKVAPRSDSESQVICIFTRDYTDVRDVNKVRDGLRRLGVKWPISYKPDIYTHCQIYQDNSWGIFPTRYRR